MANFRYRGQVVGDIKDAHPAFPVQAGEELQDLRLRNDIQRAGGFTGDQQIYPTV